MNSLPFFSVVIPTYNREAIIKNAIDSVLEQTYDNFEIIVIDNGSTDNTREIIEAYSNKIKYIYQNGSGSPASPRNSGIKNSIAPWICFLDSDDYWLPNKLESVKKAIDANSKLDVIYHCEVMFNQSNRKEKILCQSRNIKDMYQDMLEYGNKLSTSATSIKKSFLNQHQLFFNESHDFVIVEDFDLWLRVANKKASFYLLKEVLGVYVVNGKNLISDWNLYIKNLQNLYYKHIFEIQNYEKNTEKLWRIKLIEIDLLKAGHYFRSKQYFSLVIQLYRTLVNNPYYLYLVLVKRLFRKKLNEPKL